MRDITNDVVSLLGIGLTAQGAASLDSDGSLTSSAIAIRFAGSQVTGESELTGDATNVRVASASLAASSDLTSALFLSVFADSALSGDSEVASAASLSMPAASALSSDSSVTATMLQRWPGNAVLSAAVSLTVTPNVIALAVALSNGGSNLTANGVRVQAATARIMALEVVGAFSMIVSHPVQPRPIVASSALTATIRIPPRVLVLPTVEYAFTENVLLERYPIDNGRSLLISSGVGQIGDFFAQEQIRLADYYFGGGRRHELTPEQEAAVVAAGYGDLIVTEYL